jgi:hypothetical protein
MARSLVLLGAIGLVGLLALTSPASGATSVRAAGTARDQVTPALVYNPDTDEYLALWSEDRGGGGDLYFKRLFSNGLPEGGPGRGGSQLLRDADPRATHGSRSAPGVAYNPQQQEYLVVWTEQGDGPDGNDVWLQRVAATGFARGNARLLAGGPGDQADPALAFSAARGEYLVVWSDNSRDIDDIRGQKVRANGIPFGKPLDLVQGQSNAQDPTIAVRGDDGYTLAWVDDRDGKLSIYARRVNENGVAIGGAMGRDYPLSYGSDDFTAPALDPSNGTLVYNAFNARTGLDVLGLEVYDNGASRGARSIGISVPAADQADPAVAVNGRRGEIVVLYADNRPGQFDLYAIRVQNSRPKGRDYPVLVDGALP